MQHFAWNDSVLCWIFLAEGMLCYLYRRFIEEQITYTKLFVFSFLSTVALSFSMLLSTNVTDFILSPVAPTLLILAVWWYALFRTALRFLPRRCQICDDYLEVSVFDPRALPLYADMHLQQEDVWFCRRCEKVDKRSDRDGMTLLTLPSIDQIGIATLRTIIPDSGVVKIQRVILRPLLRGHGDEMIALERSVLKKTNRIALREE